MNSFWEIIHRELRWGDLMVVFLAILSIIASILWATNNQENLTVYVYKDNLLWGEYPLNQNKIISIDQHNRIEIKNNKVRMSYSDCRDKRCVKQGFSDSLPIICMPNRVIVEIGSAENRHKLILQ